MKKTHIFFLIFIVFYFTGCAVQNLVEPVLKEGTTKLEIALSSECLITLNNAKLSSDNQYSEGNSPIHTTTKKVYFADTPCNSVSYEHKSFGSGRWYFLTKFSEQLEANDRSCSTEIIQGLDFTTCSRSGYISTQSKKHSGYDNEKILYVSNSCLDKLKNQFKICTTKDSNNLEKQKASQSTSNIATDSSLLKYPTTGSEFTEVWKKYDEYSKENNKPKLDFVSTSKKFDKTKFLPSDYSDIFTNNDEEMYIFAKFSNVYGTPFGVIEIYEPSGKLYSMYKTQYKYNTGKWVMYSDFQIKEFPAEEMNGVWKANILIDNKLAYTKEFTMNSNILSEKINIKYGNPNC